MKSLRTKGRSTVVWLLMGMLLLGLGGFGVTNFSGGASGANLGSVGGTPVTVDDYLRGVRSEMQNFSAQTGQAVTAEQAQAIGIPQAVQARLFAAAALEDETDRLGVSVGDEAVGRQITGAPGFQDPSGRFDKAAYQDILRREGLSVAGFEHDVRMDTARALLQRAVIGGISAPPAVADRTARWLLQTRDIGWQELTAADLTTPIATPDETTLKAWHEANAPVFTAPETKQISYAWLTPEMLADTVTLDDQALRDLYDRNIAEYRQPERRMVERLVYPTEAEAAAAKARLDAGQATFEQLAGERGLQLTDIDLGEVTQSDLGAAGAPVFGLDQPGVVGPIMTDLGPALFSMNAILEPLDVPFEQAAPDLRAEAAADAARRQIEDQSASYEDLLAGGATLEDMTSETPMQLDRIDWTADMQVPAGSIAAYQAFREHAATLGEKDFPELFQLDDGGVFAMRLDKLVPPTLIPFDQARDAVLADWTAAETRRQLRAMAEERKVALVAGTDPAPADGSAFTPATGLVRDGAIDGAPTDVVAAAFRMKKPGDVDVVVADDRVFLLRLDGVHDADLSAEDAAITVAGVTRRLTEFGPGGRVRLLRARHPGGSRGHAEHRCVGGGQRADPVMDLSPDFAQFTAGWTAGRNQLVTIRLAADLDTPVSLMLKLAAAAPLSFMLESVTGGEVRGRYSIVGMKPDLIWDCRDGRARINREARFSDAFTNDDRPALDSLRALIAESRIDMPGDIPPVAAGLFGYLGYDMIRLVEHLPDVNPDPIGVPDAMLLRPSVVAVLDGVKGEVTLCAPAWHDPAVPARAAYAQAAERVMEALRSLDRHPAEPRALGQGATVGEPRSNFAHDAYLAAVERAKDYIRAGDIFQVVPSQRWALDFPLPPFALYRSLRRTNPSPFMFFLNMGGFQIVGASPEILVRLRDGEVTIRPIAGTRPRGATPEQDRALEADLLADEKELAEHLMLLDLGRNDVGRVARIGTVRPTEQFIVERYSHVMHIVSNVVGELNDGEDALSALLAGLPAGTVSGAPKVRAMEIIDELEPEKRGIYGGAVGYFAANGEMDMCIALRTGVIKDGQLYVQAGGGVTHDSDPESEYQETRNKARALVRAAEGAAGFLRGNG